MTFAQTLTRLLIVAAITWGTMLVLSLPQLSDPLIRWDDYPAFFGDEAAFYEKTLTEGRWLNYLWIARPVLWSAQVNFVVYHAGWALFAAGAALSFLGPQSRTPLLILLSTMIALSPQAFLISAWFNTLIAAVWYLAIYAILSNLMSARANLYLFAVLAPISMLLYSLFPFVLICFCALRHDAHQSFTRFIGLILLLGGAIVAGMMLMNTLNYFEHGVFDIVLAEDRTFLPPATTISVALSNAQNVLPLFVVWLFQTIAFGVTWLGVVIFVTFFAALILLLRAEPIRALYAVGLIGAFLGVVLLHAVMEGIMVPMRSLIAVWVVICATLFQAIRHLPDGIAPRHVDLAFLVVLAMLGGQFVRNTAFLVPWQEETRRLAERIPAETRQIYLWGHYEQVAGAKRAHVLHMDALTERLEKLTGAPVFLCNDNCPVDPPALQGGETDHMIVARQSDAFVVLVDPS